MKQHSITYTNIHEAVFAALGLFLILFLAGCPDKPEEDYSVSLITIYNVPLKIPVKDNAAEANSTLKMYLIATNSLSYEVPYQCKGVVWMSLDSESTTKNQAFRNKVTVNEANNTYTVKMQLLKPNPGWGTAGYNWNYNLDTGFWSGTANFFTVLISPDTTVPHGVNAVWIKAGYTLNKGKLNIDWDKLINSRSPGPITEKQINDLYRDIITNDPEVITN